MVRTAGDEMVAEYALTGDGCDFCEEPATVTYDTSAVTSRMRAPDTTGRYQTFVTEHDAGSWRVCDECARLVESGGRIRLIGRSIRMLVPRFDVSDLPRGERRRLKREMRASITSTVNGFMAADRGPAQPLMKDQVI